MSAILLGVCDEKIDAGAATSWDCSKLGGTPDWHCVPPAPQSDPPAPQSDPPAPRCSVCGDPLALVTQLYCPLSGSPYHRTLYVFACLRKTCWLNNDSWKVYRCQSLDSAYLQKDKPATTAKTTSMSVDTWGDDADDWGDDDMATDTATVVTDTATVVTDTATVETDTATVVTDQATLVTDQATVATNDLATTATEELATMGTDLAGTVIEDLVTMVTDSVTTRDHSSGSDKPDIDPENEVVEKMEELDLSPGGREECIAEDVSPRPENTSLYALIAAGEGGPGVTPSGREVTPTGQAASPALTPTELAAYYLSVFTEPDKDQRSLDHERRLLQQYQATEGVDVSRLLDRSRQSGGGGGERYEKTAVTHGDNIFYKFQKRMQRCPQQVIRYSYGGRPLPLTPLHPAPAPCCPCCGAPRQYELQLMPALVGLLTATQSSAPAVEFGTVLVYTCSRSCWDARPGDTGAGGDDDAHTPREETVIVQADTDSGFFR